MHQVNDKQYLGTLEAARVLGVSYAKFRKIVSAGDIRPIPGTKTYRRRDLRRLIEGGEKDGHVEPTRSS